MAKKDKKDKKASKGVEADAIAAVRSAVERTLSASAEGAQSTRDRTREIVDEIAAAAGRVRHTLEDMRVLDEVKRLRREVEALASRVASLEIKPGGESESKPAAVKTAARKPSARKPAVKRAAGATRKPAAKRTAAAKKPAAAKRGPGRPPGVKRAAAAKPAAAKPAAAPAKPAAARPAAKPAAAPSKPAPGSS